MTYGFMDIAITPAVRRAQAEMGRIISGPTSTGIANSTGSL